MNKINHFWHVVINPMALNGKSIRFWKKIAGDLIEDGFEFIEWTTTKKENAIDLAESILKKGGKNILVVGGDGTLNEVINGVMRVPELTSQITICVVPAGTGNDWAKTHLLKPNPTIIKEMLKAGKIIKHDIGAVRSIKKNEIISRFFINIAGFGFDAEVVKRVHESRKFRIGNRFIYLKNLLKTLVFYHPVECFIDHDGIRLKANVFSIAAGICKYNGNGMKQVPMADFQDGLLDFVIICNMPLVQLVLQIPNLFSGKHILHHKIFHFRAKKCIITPMNRFLGEVEGEMLEEGIYEVENISKNINFLVPKNMISH